MGLSTALRDRFGGEVPGRLEDLVTLPGVGRKTANVVLGNAFGVARLTVDTHFGRLVRRWKWTEQEDPEKVEAEVAAIFPKSEWTMLSHRVIFHGRRICHSRKPACGACPIAQLCPSYGEGETDPEKAKKLLKYEMGGYPGQRLKPARRLPGQARPAAGRPESTGGPGPGRTSRHGPRRQRTGRGEGRGHRGVGRTGQRTGRGPNDARRGGTIGRRRRWRRGAMTRTEDHDGGEPVAVTADGLPDWLRAVERARTVPPSSSAASCRPRAAAGGSPPCSILFGEGERGPELLLMERSSSLRSHAGQPSFPGGALDPEDGDPAAAGRCAPRCARPRRRPASTRRASSSSACCPSCTSRSAASS